MRAPLVGTLLVIGAFNPPAVRSEEIEEQVHTQSIMAQSIELERKVLASTLLVRDSSLVAFVSKMTETLILPDDKKDIGITVHILKSRSFNAFATPHGAIYLCSGLVARMENKSELASIIGHEMTHIMKDHSLLEMKLLKKKAHEKAVTQIGLDFFIGGLSNAVAGTVFKAAVTGYSRDLERQADSIGLLRMKAAGYPQIGFRTMFQKLKKYIIEEKIKEPYFFSTHPRIEERIKNYHQIVGSDTVAATGEDGKDAGFISVLRPLILSDAYRNFSSGKYSLAEHEVRTCLKTDSCLIDGLLLLGDIARFEKDSGSAPSPSEWYARALACDPQSGPALKKMGLYCFSIDEKARARRYLSAYRSCVGDAYDRGLIESYLRLCPNEE